MFLARSWSCACTCLHVSVFHSEMQMFHIAHMMTFTIFRSKTFDRVTSSSIELLTSDGSVAVKGTFDVMLNLCNITYVTTTAEYDKLLIHVHNGYTATRTIHQVSL